MMIRRVMASTVVLAALLLAGETVYAAPAIGSVNVPVQAKIGQGKLIKFQLRNDSKTPIKVKAGDQEITIEPGKIASVKLPEGTTIVAENSTPHIAVGSVLATVHWSMADATVVLD